VRWRSWSGLSLIRIVMIVQDIDCHKRCKCLHFFVAQN